MEAVISLSKIIVYKQFTTIKGETGQRFFEAFARIGSRSDCAEKSLPCLVFVSFLQFKMKAPLSAHSSYSMKDILVITIREGNTRLVEVIRRYT